MTITLRSDTYVSVVDADEYWALRSDSVWSAASTANKEKALRAATAYLDSNFRWVGRIEDTDQLLGWPRTCAYDHEGRELTGIPQRVADATAELAKLALGGPLVSMALGGTTGAMKRKKLGPVEFEYDTASSSASEGYAYVISLLRGIGASPMKSTRSRIASTG